MDDQASRLKTTRTDGIVVVELADRKILDEAIISQIADQLYALVAEDDNGALDERNAERQRTRTLEQVGIAIGAGCFEWLNIYTVRSL